MELNSITNPMQVIAGKNNANESQKVVKEFASFLSDSLVKVNQDLKNAEKLTQDFALGKDVELHQVVLATEQASLALQLTVQVRNKVIEAYQELMRMQV